MTRSIYILTAAAILIISALPLLADGPVFSGSVESNSTGADATVGNFTWAAEQYANIRMKAYVGDKASINAAMNGIVTSAKEDELDSTAEIERLYFSYRGEKVDVDSGFMRMAFGYGQAFRPTDILNPPNPVYPEARPKGALGAIAAFYPDEDTKVQIFGADRTNPYVQYDGYSRPLAGGSGEIHTPKLSAQALIAVQSPEERGSKLAVHYWGYSMKFDAVAGFALDTLFTYDSKDQPSLDGLQFAFGADYSFFDGDLYVLGQYFFNGDGQLGSDQNMDDLYGGSDWSKLPYDERMPFEGFSDYYRKHYLFTSATYSFDDYTRLTGSVLSALEDASFLPALTVEHEPFQGMVLSLTGRTPLDSWLFGGGTRGELGADQTGYSWSLLGSAKLKF